MVKQAQSGKQHPESHKDTRNPTKSRTLANGQAYIPEKRLDIAVVGRQLFRRKQCELVLMTREKRR